MSNAWKVVGVDGCEQRYARIGVMCLGNILMADEGIGLRVGEALTEAYGFPESVDILDAGTMGMALLSDFKRYDLILTVDAVDGTGLAPGTLVRFEPSDIASYSLSHSAHDMRFVDVLEAAALLGSNPVGRCLGIQVRERNPEQLTMELTPEVAAAIPQAVQAVLAFLVRECAVSGIIEKSSGLPVAAENRG